MTAKRMIVIIFAALLVGIGISLSAQRVYEVSCPAGSNDLNGPTYNPSTHSLRSWVCVDPLGFVTFIGKITGTSFPTGVSPGPTRIELAAPIAIVGQTIVLTEPVTFPSVAGTYRAAVSYTVWMDGSNSCAGEVIDTTNGRAFAGDYADANGGGAHNGLAASEVSPGTYAASSTATFTLQVMCNGAETATIDPALFAFTVPEHTYLSVTPVFGN